MHLERKQTATTSRYQMVKDQEEKQERLFVEQPSKKHSKLKSLLQKRYFEGQESSTDNKVPPEQKSDEKVAEMWDVNKNMSSNLDLLASAADIHTVSARGTQEHRVQAIRRLQEESERQFHTNAAKRLQEESERQFHTNAAKRLQEESERQFHTNAAKRLQDESERQFHTNAAKRLQEESERQFHANVSKRLQEESGRQFHTNAAKRLQNNSDEKSSTSGRMPVLLKLMTSSSPLSETRSHDKDTISGHHNNSLRTLSPEISQRVSPVTSVHGNQHVKVISSQVEKNTSPFLNRDRAQQMVQPYKNGYRSTLPQETVVLRRDLSSSSDEGSLKFGKKHSVPVTRSIPSWSSDVDQSSCTAHNNHTGSTSMYPLNNHNFPQHYQNYSSNYIEPYRYHGSRIASIIAEELQKDDDCANEPPARLSLVRAIPSENVSSNTHETTRSRSFSLPGTYKRETSKESANCVSQILPIYNTPKYNITDGSKETVVNGYLTRTTSKILPAHLTIANAPSASGILPPHVGQTNTAVNNGFIRNSNTSQDDDQPQDLSTKSRRLMENELDGHHFSNSVAHVIESEFRDISRSISHNDRSHHFESPSSCSQLPCECDLDSRRDTGSTPIKTSEMERKSQVHGLDINLEGVNDDHIVTKRNHREIACSETGDPGIPKRMKLE